MRKKLFIPIFMLLLVIIGVGVNSISSQAQSKKSVLKIETIFDISKENDYVYVVSKKNRAILQNNNGQTATGKYAYITNDKKIRWDKPAYYEYSPRVAEMIKQITLNGKSITIPTTIENLGREYKEFSRVDYSKLKGMRDILIKNTNNNYKFLFFKLWCFFSSQLLLFVVSCMSFWFELWALIWFEIVFNSFPLLSVFLWAECEFELISHVF